MFALARRRHVPVVDPTAADGVFSLLWLVDRAARRSAPLILLVGGPLTRGRSTGGATCSAAPCRSARSCSAWLLFVPLLGRDDDDRQVVPAPLHLVRGRRASNVDIDLLYDPLSALFLLLITGVGSLIHVYSIGYMEHDARRRRFFGYLNLFVAAMLMLVLVGQLPRPVPRLGGRRPGVVPADRLLAAQAHPRPPPPRRPSSSTGSATSACRWRIMLMFVDLRHHRLHRRSAPVAGEASETTMTVLGLLLLLGRLRQVGPGAAAVLAARRDGGPDPGVGADPRGDHGDRRRLPHRPLQLHLRPRARRPDRRGHRRRRHAAVGRDHRLRQGRHQEGPGRLDDEPDRLHDARPPVSASPATPSRSSTCSPTASSRPTCSSAPAR